MAQTAADIDALVREEMRMTAAESHAEAWAEGVSAGIELEIMAESALETALAEIVTAQGEDAAMALIERMRDKLIGGELDYNRTRH